MHIWIFTSPRFFPAHSMYVVSMWQNCCSYQNRVGWSTHYMPNLPGHCILIDTMEANILIECKTSLLASIHSFCTLKNVQVLLSLLANYPSQAKCFQQVAIFLWWPINLSCSVTKTLHQIHVTNEACLHSLWCFSLSGQVLPWFLIPGRPLVQVCSYYRCLRKQGLGSILVKPLASVRVVP